MAIFGVDRVPIWYDGTTARDLDYCLVTKDRPQVDMTIHEIKIHLLHYINN